MKKEAGKFSVPWKTVLCGIKSISVYSPLLEHRGLIKARRMVNFASPRGQHFSNLPTQEHKVYCFIRIFTIFHQIRHPRPQHSTPHFPSSKSPVLTWQDTVVQNVVIDEISVSVKNAECVCNIRILFSLFFFLLLSKPLVVYLSLFTLVAMTTIV